MMKKDKPVDIIEIERISLKKGDVLAIHIDVGLLPRQKAEDYIRECIVRYRGAFPDDVKTLFLPYRDGKKVNFTIIAGKDNDEKN